MRHVVITTNKRGVFFGELTEHDGDKKIATLKNARMCVYWPASVRGVVGLAATGPKEGAKITPACPFMEITDVTAIMDCTSESVAAWEKGLWS